MEFLRTTGDGVLRRQMKPLKFALILYMLTASDEPSIHELQHVNWNCLLVKILAFEPAAKGDFLGNTGHALHFESDNSDILATRLVPNNISGIEIDAH
jgi:hypothetical protein